MRNLTREQTSEFIAWKLNRTLHIRTLDAWTKSGKGPVPIKIGRHVSFTPEAISTWFCDQGVSVAPEDVTAWLDAQAQDSGDAADAV